MNTRAVFALVAVACIIAHVYAADWGMNGTLTVHKSEAFTPTTEVEPATSVSASRAVLDNNIWILSYRSAANVSDIQNRLKLWQIVMGDKPSNSIAPHAASSTSVPPALGSMTALGYTAPNSQSIVFANVMSAGGIPPNGVRSTESVTSAVAIANNALSYTLDDFSFPNLPVGRSNGIIGSDLTAALKIDGDGYANASVYIYGGEYDSGVTGSMLKMRTPAGASIPTGWDEITPLGPYEPEPRSYHAGVTIGTQWYVFGGRNETHVFGDLWVFDFSNYNWTLLHDFGLVPISQADQPWTTDLSNQTLPMLPPARFGHSMTVMKGANLFGNSNEIIILAAGTNNATYFNDVWAFDPLYNAWERINLPTAYTPRAFGALMASHNESYVWFYGGQDSTTYYGEIWTLDFTEIPPKGPSFKSLPNNIIAGVAGGILLVLIITVVVLKVTDRNSS